MSVPTNMRVRLSQLKDIPAMSAVEKSAASAFLAIPELSWLAASDVMSPEAHRKAITAKTCWAAEDKHTNSIVGFLCAEEIGTELHLQEVSVHADVQGQGIGTTLIDAALDDAALKGLQSATLTTFIDVPWNAPFYEKLGFEIIKDKLLGDRLSSLLLEEARHGLHRNKRCAMRKPIGLGL